MEKIATYVVDRLSMDPIARAVNNSVGSTVFDAGKVVGQIESVLRTGLTNFVKSFADTLSMTMNDWYDQESGQLAIYPRGTRLVHRKGVSQTIVIEEEPKVRTLLFENTGRTEEDGKGWKNQYTVGLPYIIFTTHFVDKVMNCMTVTFRPKPLTSLDDMLYDPCFPNQGADLKVCMSLSTDANWAQITGRKEYEDASISERAAQAIRYFWNSRFTVDHLNVVWGWYKEKYPDKLGSLDQWEKATIQDKMFFLGLDMKGHCTLRDHIKVIGQDATAFSSVASNTKARLNTQINVGLHDLVKNLEKSLVIEVAAVSGDASKITEAVTTELKRIIQMACVMSAAEVERHYGIVDEYSSRTIDWKSRYYSEKQDHMAHIKMLLDIRGFPDDAIWSKVMDDIGRREYEELGGTNQTWDDYD
jgi:hypothetical protein